MAEMAEMAEMAVTIVSTGRCGQRCLTESYSNYTLQQYLINVLAHDFDDSVSNHHSAS